MVGRRRFSEEFESLPLFENLGQSSKDLNGGWEAGTIIEPRSSKLLPEEDATERPTPCEGRDEVRTALLTLSASLAPRLLRERHDDMQ